MLPCMEPPEVGPSGDAGWPMDGQVGSLQASEAVGQRPDQDFFSALGGIRTPNLLIRSQMLYPLSYERRTHPMASARIVPPEVGDPASLLPSWRRHLSGGNLAAAYRRGAVRAGST